MEGMDPSSLAQLVQEQAKIIEQLRLDNETKDERFKADILSSLKSDLQKVAAFNTKGKRGRGGGRGKKRTKWRRRPDESGNFFSENAEMSEGSDANVYVGSDEATPSVIVRSSQVPPPASAGGGSSIILSSNGETKRAQTTAPIPQSYNNPPSSSARRATGSSARSSNHRPSSMDTLMDSPLGMTSSLSAVPKKAKKSAGLISSKARTAAAATTQRKKVIPLSPTSHDSAANSKIDKSTMLFLHKSAMLVNDATGKDASAIMASTFNQALPAPVVNSAGKKKKKYKKKSATSEIIEQENFQEEDNNNYYDDDEDEDEKTEELQQEHESRPKGPPRPSQTAPAPGGAGAGAGAGAVKFSTRKGGGSGGTTSNLGAWSPGTPQYKGLPNVVQGGGEDLRSGLSTANNNTKSPSRRGSGRNTATRTSQGARRPRTVGPSTVATVRSEAESLGRKLLGPLNLDGGSKKAPLPAALEESEWENELARNILSLYSNQVVEEIKVKKEAEAEAGQKKTRRMRRMKELKKKGLKDEEIEEIMRKSERHSRKSFRMSNTRSGRASRKSSTHSRADLGMKDTAASILSGLLMEGEKADMDQKGSDVGANPAPLTATAANSSKARSRRGRRSTAGSLSSVATMSSTVKDNNAVVASSSNSESENKVVAPVRPKPIWFGGTGAIQAEWGALEEFATSSTATLRKDLEAMKEKGRYTTYIATIEGLLSASMRVQADLETTQLMERLWRQMVVTCNAFGVRCLEQKKYPKALELLEKANELAGYEDIIPHHLVQELKAFVMDSFAYYYMRRNKPSAALQYIINAMKAHNRRKDWPHVAKCHLHTACILSKLERHDESIRCLGQVLSMVDDGFLEVSSNNAQQLLMVSVAYHNIAVEQLILRHISEACVSSQNARRLARLCLSYSNRYLPNFEATHVAALKELAASVRHKHSDDEHQIFSKLAAGLYS